MHKIIQADICKCYSTDNSEILVMTNISLLQCFAQLPGIYGISFHNFAYSSLLAAQEFTCQQLIGYILQYGSYYMINISGNTTSFVLIQYDNLVCALP